MISPALAQKQGGTLRMPLITSPASMSIHEESTIAVLGPMMGVFNNLVMFDQHVPQNSLSSIVPDLAESWSTSEDGKSLTFKLRQGVKWHDGKPFTASRRQMHLGHDRRQRAREVPRQPAQILVPQPRLGHGRRRPPGHVPPEAAAALVYRAARLGLVAGLSLPCAAGADAARSRSAPDRSSSSSSSRTSRSRSPATRITGRRTGPISTRSNTRYMANPSTAILAFAAGNFDRYAPGHPVAAADEAAQGAGAERGLRGGAVEHPAPAARQPRRSRLSTTPNCAAPSVLDARPQGLYRHHQRQARARSAAR